MCGRHRWERLTPGRSNIPSSFHMQHKVSPPDNQAVEFEDFFKNEDQQTIRDFNRLPNKPMALFIMAFPSLISLALCPVTLILASPLMNLFWPREVFQTSPKVNDVISCYLTPAGLIYAIAFGFAFQEAMEKQTKMKGCLFMQVTGVNPKIFNSSSIILVYISYIY